MQDSCPAIEARRIVLNQRPATIAVRFPPKAAVADRSGTGRIVRQTNETVEKLRCEPGLVIGAVVQSGAGAGACPGSELSHVVDRFPVSRMRFCAAAAMANSSAAPRRPRSFRRRSPMLRFKCPNRRSIRRRSRRDRANSGVFYSTRARLRASSSTMRRTRRAGASVQSGLRGQIRQSPGLA